MDKQIKTKYGNYIIKSKDFDLLKFLIQYEIANNFWYNFLFKQKLPFWMKKHIAKKIEKKFRNTIEYPSFTEEFFKNNIQNDAI